MASLQYTLCSITALPLVLKRSQRVDITDICRKRLQKAGSRGSVICPDDQKSKRETDVRNKFTPTSPSPSSVSIAFSSMAFTPGIAVWGLFRTGVNRSMPRAPKIGNGKGAAFNSSGAAFPDLQAAARRLLSAARSRSDADLRRKLREPSVRVLYRRPDRDAHAQIPLFCHQKMRIDKPELLQVDGCKSTRSLIDMPLRPSSGLLVLKRARSSFSLTALADACSVSWQVVVIDSSIRFAVILRMLRTGISHAGPGRAKAEDTAAG